MRIGKGSAGNGLRHLGIPGCLALFAGILFRLVLLAGYVPTGSMEPTIARGSFILGSRIYGQPELGDVVVFRREGALHVKRICGVPGDWIRWDELSYAEGYPRPIRRENCIRVPPGHYFMLGDCGENSLDSRYWEDPFLPEEHILAKLILPDPDTYNIPG